MWSKQCLWFLPATVVASLMILIACQETDGPKPPETFKCVTHNLETWVCSWNDSSSAVNTAYEVCYRSFQQCTTTQETSIEFEAYSFQSREVKIIAKKGNGSVERVFQLSESDVPFVPYEPQVLRLTPQLATSSLSVEWKGNSSSFVAEVDVSWEIQFLRTDNLGLAKAVLYNTTWTEDEAVFQYNWTSDLPLECTSHSVRIRYLVNEKPYKGAKEWSDWSNLKTVSGSNTAAVYPDEKVILEGSNMTFCCIVDEGTKVLSLTYDGKEYPRIHLGKYSSAIQVYNVKASVPSGTNIICNVNSGTVLFVGYPPDVPQHFSCETHTFDVINCTWNVGRQTHLLGTRETKFFLYEGFSGQTVQCGAPEAASQRHRCNFKIIENENLYNFTLSATNPLGASHSSLLIDVRRRVHTKVPENVYISDASPRNVNLSWALPGNFSALKLICQIETVNQTGHLELKNITLNGQYKSSYSASVNGLHPFRTYVFRVRCAAFEHFWKWSEWSFGKTHLTSEAPPEIKPDVWREILPSSAGRTLILYWKPLSEDDANGEILNYAVTWTSLNGDTLPERRLVSGPENKTKITLDDNDNYVISVVASNSAGISPSANVSTMDLPNDNLETEYAVGTGDGINITWQRDPNITCGVTVQWRPSLQHAQSPLDWYTVASDRSDVWLPSSRFRPGVRYTFSVYGCKNYEYKLMKTVTGYIEELWPIAAPNFTVNETTSNSVQIKWEDLPVEDLRGFLRGYLIFISKDGNTTSALTLQQGRANGKIKNITDTETKIMTIRDLKSGTRYRLGLKAYTGGGESEWNSMYVDTPDNLVGLIMAIFIPIAVALLLGVVITTVCYRKREWLKETFYPEIPNPQNSKALQFENSVCEGNPALKTLEMNPCTPNTVEVVETLSTIPKIVDTELISPGGDSDEIENNLIDYDSETENHTVVSYCPPIIEEEIPNLPAYNSADSSQVIYLDVQSMYQPQAKSEEETDIDLEDIAGYKPQMQLPDNSVKPGGESPPEDGVDPSVGYKPQVNANNWNAESPDSPSSAEGFGSPCSVNSRHFLIPPEDEKDSGKPTHIGWNFTSFFQNKPDE